MQVTVITGHLGKYSFNTPHNERQCFALKHLLHFITPQK